MTEKASKSAGANVYMFQIAESANKYQVKNTIEEVFNVKVSKVTVTIRKGKTRRVGKKMTTKALADRKIAYVTLKEGKIDLFPKA